MKKIFLFICIICSILATTLHTHADTLSNKQQITAMPSGQKILTAIDNFVDKIQVQSKKNPDFEAKILGKIATIKQKYSQKTDEKSTKIVIILTYMESEIPLKSGSDTLRILSRFQKVESDSYKNKSKTRQAKAKTKRYQRIHRNR